MEIFTKIEHWPYKNPFRIANHLFDGMDVLVVTVQAEGLSGRGEAAGVYYHGETAASMAAQVHEIIRGGAALDRNELLGMLPPGGARNAIDCALWDFEAKKSGQPVWKLAGLQGLSPLLTTYTLGADTPGKMAAMALAYPAARALKLKLMGDEADAERVRTVRAARPDVWMGVDANQGFTPLSFHRLLPVLVAAKVDLIEQPFPRDRDCDLDGLGSPIPIALDESVQDRNDLAGVVGRAKMVNIKLDKCGGLTEALAMVHEARRIGLNLMVGNMVGTSLAIAPAFLLGQFCDLADLDGPIFLRADRAISVRYDDGYVAAAPAVWGDGA